MPGIKSPPSFVSTNFFLSNLCFMCYDNQRTTDLILKNENSGEFSLKKKELTFIIGIVVFALILWTGMYFIRRGHYGTVQITVNGEEYGIYSLAKDQVIRINDTNVCEIKDGEIHMTEANCPDHLCMKQKAVDSTGGTIVCLPNKVVIEGEKGDASEDDSPEFDTVV